MTRFRTTLPAERSFNDWERKRKEQRIAYWATMHKIRQDYMEEFRGVTDLTVRPTFHYWVEEHYGLKMGIDSDGNYTEDYTIVDSKKFLILQLKYWQ